MINLRLCFKHSTHIRAKNTKNITRPANPTSDCHRGIETRIKASRARRLTLRHQINRLQCQRHWDVPRPRSGITPNLIFSQHHADKRRNYKPGGHCPDLRNDAPNLRSLPVHKKTPLSSCITRLSDIAGTRTTKQKARLCFVVLWEAARISTISLLWCRRHEAQFGHKPGDRTLKMDHCTSRHFLH